MANEKRLVEVQLTGGLGNQLFQALAGLGLSRQTDSYLRLILPKNRRGDTPREFELDFLCDDSRISWQRQPTVFRKYVEASFEYDNRLLSIRPNIRLEGYFQSWKYFDRADIDPFQLLNQSKDFRRGLTVKVGQPSSVIGVHLRRGDYLTPRARSYHGLLPKSYFVDSVLLLRKIVGEKPVVVFSDSEVEGIELAESLKDASFLHTEDPGNALYNLGIMSQIDEWVISNSSFGWWAGFLGGGRVIAPSPWFREKVVDCRDLVRRDWLILPVTRHRDESPET